MKSKTRKIEETRRELLYLFGCFADVAMEWDPSEEGDYQSFVDSVDKILEKVVD